MNDNGHEVIGRSLSPIEIMLLTLKCRIRAAKNPYEFAANSITFSHVTRFRLCKLSSNDSVYAIWCSITHSALSKTGDFCHFIDDRVICSLVWQLPKLTFLRFLPWRYLNGFVYSDYITYIFLRPFFSISL
ncbi:hypothetical protein NPIL_431911 [Nephila pilipes]|uniref:Uncharacterized protein n=1 Tax=Nephila pilipes TaxID=299642 RepID=A0A8X6R1I4_NEPPI|nr:hypothetical protein NPIL_219321 [Nephila pilipes]GFU61851.1 hypothetical protein NPIL_431911 [Nephila pilipes]